MPISTCLFELAITPINTVLDSICKVVALGLAKLYHCHSNEWGIGMLYQQPLLASAGSYVARPSSYSQRSRSTMAYILHTAHRI